MGWKDLSGGAKFLVVVAVIIVIAIIGNMLPDKTTDANDPPSSSGSGTWKLIYHNDSNEKFKAVPSGANGYYTIDAIDDCVFLCADWDVPCASASSAHVTLYFVDNTYFDAATWYGDPCGKTFDLQITSSGRLALTPL